MTLGERLRAERAERGLTQWDVARLVGIGSNVVLSRYESDERMPDPETLRRLADFYRVSVDYLLGRTDIRQPGKTGDDGVDPIDAEFEALMNDPEARVILRATKGLPRHAKKSVIDYIEFMRRKFEEEEPGKKE